MKEILLEDSSSFRLEAAFTGIVLSALAQPGKPSTLEIIGDILDTAARAYCVTGVLALNQKKIYNRARAVQYFPELDPPIWLGHSSYPSGHSTQAHASACCPVLAGATAGGGHRLRPMILVRLFVPNHVKEQIQ